MSNANCFSQTAGDYGIGRHVWDIPPEWLLTGLKVSFYHNLAPTALSTS